MKEDEFEDVPPFMSLARTNGEAVGSLKIKTW